MQSARIQVSRLLGILLVAVLAACSVSPYRHEPGEQAAIEQRAQRQASGDIIVSASVPGPQETERLFGVPLYDSGIQPVWLQIKNTSASRARFVLSSVDKEYFSPHEVAYMHRHRFSTQGWQDMENFLVQTAMPRVIPPGETASGFVYTHLSPGTKSFNTVIFYATEEPEYEFFTFFLPVPGFVPDHAEIDFASLYAPEEVQRVSSDALREALAKLPCCNSNRDDTGQGQPIDLVLVAPGKDLLRALLRAGWSETSYQRDEEYLDAAHYLFGRPPDSIFRKRSGKTTERLELFVWLSPILVDGETVWVAQTRHALGRRFEFGEWVLGSKIDPDVNDGRNYVLQDMWYAQALDAYGFTSTGLVVPDSSPVTDFNGNPFFSDGLRIVLWISGRMVALSDTKPIGWPFPEDFQR
ncbi:MAG: LssY C-terminal domain-containing protein [Lysobacterales bacterium]|jgi:hypothetical protein